MLSSLLFYDLSDTSIIVTKNRNGIIRSKGLLHELGRTNEMAQ